MAFHVSSSVSRKIFKKRLIKFILNLVKKASTDNGKVRLGLASFGDKFQEVFNLGHYVKKKDIKRAIKKTPKKLKSDIVNLSSALENIRTRMFIDPQDRPEVQNYIILISDAPDQDDRQTLLDEREKLGNTIIQGISIGLADKNLESIASDPKKKFYKVFRQFDDLSKFKKSGKLVQKNIPACK